MLLRNPSPQQPEDPAHKSTYSKVRLDYGISIACIWYDLYLLTYSIKILSTETPVELYLYLNGSTKRI